MVSSCMVGLSSKDENISFRASISLISAYSLFLRSKVFDKSLVDYLRRSTPKIEPYNTLCVIGS